MQLVRTEYEVENNKPVIYAFCREDGKRVVHKEHIRPYFYVPYKERERLQLDRDPDEFTDIYGEHVTKVYVNIPSDVALVRNQYSKTWESDILFPLRYQIDCIDNIEKTDIQTMYLDIETDGTGHVPDPKYAKEAIVCITARAQDCYTTFIFREDFVPGKQSKLSWDTLHEVIYYRTEKEMLLGFLDYFNCEAPDLLTGWNVIQFDLTYLINRMERLGIESNRLSPMGKVSMDDKEQIVIKGINVIDMLSAYRRFSQWTQGLKESYKLDFIGQEVAGIGKCGDGSEVRWMWKYNPDKLIEYNANDCRICYEINKKIQLLEFLDELRRLCHCQFEDTLTMTRLADCYILHMFHGKKVFPSRIRHDKYSYEGAIVESHTRGLHTNVGVFDIRSMYPSIIVTAGLSPETMRSEPEKNAIQLGKHYVRTDIQGFLPQVIEHLFTERAKYKKLRSTVPYDSEEYTLYHLRQEALKRLLNALYGQTAYVNSRIYDYRVAETITWMGRQLITWSKNFLEILDHEVIYIDTDSLHVPFDSFDIDYSTAVLELLNESYDEFVQQYGLKTHRFEMEFQKVYRKVFYGTDTKKRYAGAVCWREGKIEDHLDVWGFEIKRSDSSFITRRMQERVFNMLLREDKNKEEILEYIGEEIDKIRKGYYKFTELGIPKGMSKDPHSYINKPTDTPWLQKGLPANVRGTLYSIHQLKNDISNKPKLLYVKQLPENYPPIDVICFDNDNQIPPGTQIDTEKMLDKIIRAKLDTVFSGLGWSLKDLVPWWRGKAPKGGEALTMFNLDDFKVTGTSKP